MLKYTLTFVFTLLLLSPQAFASLTRVLITPEKQKEHNLNFTLSIQEKDDFYQVNLEAPKEGALEKLFHIGLVIYEGDKLLLAVPLEQHRPFLKNERPSVQFTLAKGLLNGAVLDLSTGNGLQERVYRLQLVTYPREEPSKQ